MMEKKQLPEHQGTTLILMKRVLMMKTIIITFVIITTIIVRVTDDYAPSKNRWN